MEEPEQSQEARFSNRIDAIELAWAGIIFSLILSALTVISLLQNPRLSHAFYLLLSIALFIGSLGLKWSREWGRRVLYIGAMVLTGIIPGWFSYWLTYISKSGEHAKIAGMLWAIMAPILVLSCLTGTVLAASLSIKLLKASIIQYCSEETIPPKKSRWLTGSVAALLAIAAGIALGAWLGARSWH